MGRRRYLPFVLAAVVATLAGCAANTDDPDTEQGSAEALTDGWTSLGTGVAYKDTGDGDGVWIGYAGYSVQQDWSIAWTEELHRTKLKALGVGHLYAVKGPNDAGYNAREIANTKLGAHLIAGPGDSASFILVAAHSSGTYVAHELLGQLEDRGSDTAALRKKIVYANLDGGGTGFTESIASSLKHTAFVYAQDPVAGSSANASVMQSLAPAYGTTAIRVNGAGSHCNSSARWCLHDLLITTKPHNPAMYDLHDDYTDFDDRPVQSQWIDALASHLE